MEKIEEKISAFVARLVWLKASQEMATKYVKVFRNLLHYRKNQEAQLSMYANRIKMAELCAEGKKKIASTSQLLRYIMHGEEICMMLYPELDLQSNLLKKKSKPTVKKGLKSYRPIGCISVWQEPNTDGSPCLTLEQIITQIPRGLVSNTKAVCLLNESDEDSYNTYMDSSEYRVWLLG